MATEQSQVSGGESASLELLREIRDLLERKLPDPTPPRPWWKLRAWQGWIGVLLLALFFLDFPSESRGKADIVVLNGTQIQLVKLPEPDWDAVGVKPSPEYWHVPNPRPNLHVTSLWEVSLYRQGRRYKHSAIRVLRGEKEPTIDLLSPPVRIYGPSQIVLNPFSELADEDRLIATRILRTYAFKAEGEILPLGQVIDPKTHVGRLVVETKPRVGWERFQANLAAAFRLLK